MQFNPQTCHIHTRLLYPLYLRYSLHPYLPKILFQALKKTPPKRLFQTYCINIINNKCNFHSIHEKKSGFTLILVVFSRLSFSCVIYFAAGLRCHGATTKQYQRNDRYDIWEDRIELDRQAHKHRYA